MTENDYLLIKEMEKIYSSKIMKDLKEGWDSDLEEKFIKDSKKKQIDRYYNLHTKKIHKKVDRLFTDSCKLCNKSIAKNFTDKLYIKKYGLCYGCYLKRHP